ncbi:CatB-related O-acetyltransferase [Vibrio chagasii]|uniref:CatB-related O-acetyltransferase n=1 Tax=Vibrio chagasii TaxID=170679 RepID=UPI002284D8C5|nr:CatB-related O-acetyltransferase [Vibrio chagasii]MCY9824535.1 CatB-related O-acetyltransferase [Vibrio chagasii]
MQNKHWSKFELLHEVVTNPNIHIKGQHSYYSDCWDNGFERSVVRYLHGDEVSRQWEPRWEIDELYIGDYVCIGAEVVILMGGNHTHRVDWFSLYPFMDVIDEAYIGKGDTHIKDGAWLGMRAMIMPGVTIGEGAVVAANSVVTKDVEPYSIVAGSPANVVKHRFDKAVIEELLAMKIYEWPEEKFGALRKYLCDSDLTALKNATAEYDTHKSLNT